MSCDPNKASFEREVKLELQLLEYKTALSVCQDELLKAMAEIRRLKEIPCPAVELEAKLEVCRQRLDLDDPSLTLALAQARERLEQLARLGNGEHYGNSDGNRIAQQALAEIALAVPAAGGGGWQEIVESVCSNLNTQCENGCGTKARDLLRDALAALAVPAAGGGEDKCREALELIAEEGCRVMYQGEPKGFTCVDNQRKVLGPDSTYSPEYRAKVASGKASCTVCIAKAALAAALREPFTIGGIYSPETERDLSENYTSSERTY